MTLTSGTWLGPYEIVSSLGSGGMGEVYRARDSRLSREVAVKVLRETAIADDERIYRFELEARAAGVLNHPNILAVYDVGSSDGMHYVVTELLEGETLRSRLDGRALSARKAVELALHIARGLAAAHEKGIVHRDLKPDNIFITRDGRLKILDFGLAKLTQRLTIDEMQSEAPTLRANTERGVILGTVGYMSPEQVRSLPVDPRSDIFAFGAVFYEMLSGRRAFRGDSAIETMNAILKEEPPDLASLDGSIPPSLDRLVRHCLEKDPDERFQSALDLAFDLDALSFSWSSSGASALPRTVSRRTATRAVVGLALGLVLVAGIVVGRTLGRSAPALAPSYQQITFRHGSVPTARFTPDGQTVVFTADWDGHRPGIYSSRPGSPESRSLDLPNTYLLAISSTGEMAINREGTLARVGLSGSAPRDVLEKVSAADWAPNGVDLAVVRYIDGRNRLEYPIGNLLFETDNGISHVRVSPKGDRVAFLYHPVSQDDRGSVMVVDTNRTVTTLSEGWPSLQGLAWAPGGDEIWFAGAESAANRALCAVTLAGVKRVVTRVAGSLILHDISRDGRVLTTREDYRVKIFGQAPGETKERDLSWLDGSITADISEDGRTLLFSEGAQGGGTNYSVYLRKTDGSAAVRIGDGIATSLSKDGKWALAKLPTTPTRLMMLPTGPGEPRELAAGAFEEILNARWTPDGAHVVVVASEAGRKPRAYMLALDGGAPRAITPEGVRGTLVTPDGRFLTARAADDHWILFPLEGGEPQPLTEMTVKDVAVRWSGDGHWLYVMGDSETKISRVNASGAKRELWKEVGPVDSERPAYGLRSFCMTPDAKAYAYSFGLGGSELYVVDGLVGGIEAPSPRPS